MTPDYLPRGGWVCGPVLYARVPKNACTVINHWLVDLAGTRATLEASGVDIHRYVERPESGLRPATAADWADPGLFRFTLLRNPYTRLVSAYTNKLTGPRVAQNAFFGPVMQAIQAHAGLAPDPQRGVSFAETLRWLADQPDPPAEPRLDKHLRSQTWFTGIVSTRFDHVGRFEALEPTLDLLASRYGLPVRRRVFDDAKERRRLEKYRSDVAGPPVPHRPGGSFAAARGFPLPEAFFDEELVGLVERRFAADLALYRDVFGRKALPGGTVPV